MAINRGKNQSKRSTQNMRIAGYDEDFDMPAVLIVAYDAANGVLRRVACNEDGYLLNVQTDETYFLLQETGDAILQETGDKIIQDI